MGAWMFAFVSALVCVNTTTAATAPWFKVEDDCPSADCEAVGNAIGLIQSSMSLGKQDRHLSALALKANASDEEPDSTYTKIPEADLPRRPIFLFVHLEKSAGSFLGAVFANVLGANELAWHYAGTSVKHVPEEYFVVSSIRNPCSQSVSQWSYLCEKAWADRELGIWDSAASPGMPLLEAGKCPVFSGSKVGSSYEFKVDDLNVAGFRSYMQDTANQYERAFNRTFMETGPERVNCWVKVESLDTDLRKCLREYEQFSGYQVDWSTLSGQDPSRNEGKHSNCKDYYDPATTQLVRSKNAFLSEYFGYRTCCDDS
eukprot:TRINITY_DN42094_c0_g1_i1.p1 TRINITY_DN42094_c0_g1~~TRINITY_DN42094_c0_g1_i1.p1  ORF type:complete len:315 (-),score=38.67 TRINITY_DN42094_c0_g1_i1:93-1037(-)